MSIVFTCEFCGKKIEAPDNAAGKWGKCPRCHNKLFVPVQNTSEDDELKLAPIDESEIEKQKRLRAEAFNLTKNILSDREPSAGTDESAAESEADISEEKLTINIISYLRLMADGELDEADRLAKSIAPAKAKASKILDRIATSEPPEPELADIPQQVLGRLIKTLRARIM
jgi:uncharacterized protein involved in exopolysaccharide biosynthesis